MDIARCLGGTQVQLFFPVKYIISGTPRQTINITYHVDLGSATVRNYCKY